jgi:hypothetical protein
MITQIRWTRERRAQARKEMAFGIRHFRQLGNTNAVEHMKGMWLDLIRGDTIFSDSTKPWIGDDIA